MRKDLSPQAKTQFLDGKALAPVECSRIAQRQRHLFPMNCKFEPMWLKMAVDAGYMKSNLGFFVSWTINLEMMHFEHTGSTTLPATTEEMVSTSTVCRSKLRTITRVFLVNPRDTSKLRVCLQIDPTFSSSSCWDARFL
jgi:hypothetical protein